VSDYDWPQLLLDDQLPALSKPELLKYCDFFRLRKTGNKDVVVQRIEVHITQRFATHPGMKQRQAVLRALAELHAAEGGEEEEEVEDDADAEVGRSEEEEEEKAAIP
jgi:hypothetical protein